MPPSFYGEGQMISNQQFLSALFRHIQPGASAMLNSFTGDPAKDGRWNALPWKPGKPLPTLNPFANNYVCVSSFNATPDKKYYRRKVLFSALHCVMIDDLGTKLPMSDLKMKPTVLIETSPGNFQAWLFLAKPIHTIQIAEQLINEMIAAGISAEMDPGMKGVTRVARVPVGSNGKAKYRTKDGAVWPHVVHEADLTRLYTPEDIAKAYALDLRPKSLAPPPKPPRTGVDPERAHALKWLKLLGYHMEEVREGYHQVECPWVEMHSDKTASGTYYTEPEALNSWHGGFMCHHGHCHERDISDLIGWLRAQKDSFKAPTPSFIIDYNKGSKQK